MRIKQLRKLKRMTQSELAEKVNLDKSAICNYEKGYRTPTIDTVQKIAEVFGVTVDYLLGGDLVNEAPKNRTELKFFMRANGVTTNQLAAASGVNAHTIRHILNGKDSPRLTTLEQIFASLGLDASAAKNFERVKPFPAPNPANERRERLLTAFDALTPSLQDFIIESAERLSENKSNK